MITKQSHFTSARNLAKEIARLAPPGLRGNRMIDRALREAYLKFHRTEETLKL